MRCLVVCVLLFATPCGLAAAPNVVLILGDDVGWGDVRPNNPAGKVELPAIERLAAEGLRFTDAHVTASKCAPSRYSIMTGNYQWRGRKPWGVWNHVAGSQMLPGQETLGDMLRHAGYTTGFVGKWHLGSRVYIRGGNSFAKLSTADDRVDLSRGLIDGPSAHGIDSSLVLVGGIQQPPYAYFRDGQLVGNPDDWITWHKGNYGDTEIGTAGIGLPEWNTRETGQTLVDEAAAFIRSAEQPFFLHVSATSVHVPHKPPVAIGDRLVAGQSGMTPRADRLIELDATVDYVVRELEAQGIADDTIIIVSSDNGAANNGEPGQYGHKPNGNWRGYKATIYEGGHRVPLIMRWGDRLSGVSNALVGVHDLYATLEDLTNTESSQGRDSVSLMPILLGEASSVRDSMVFEADSPDKLHPGGISGNHFAYRSGDWKLVCNASEQPVGLYKLSTDPGEAVNRVNEPGQSGRVADMRTALLAVLASARTAP